MIKIDVLLRAAEYLEHHSEKSLSSSSSTSSCIELLDAQPMTTTSPPPSGSNSNSSRGGVNSCSKRDARDKSLSRSDKAIHNTLEKNRRAHLKDCFDHLQKELPAFKEKKKATNLSILNYTLKFIQQSQKKDKENEAEISKLAKKRETLMSVLRQHVCQIETEEAEFKSLVYKQIKNPTLLDTIEKAKSEINNVNSPIEETTNEMICGSGESSDTTCTPPLAAVKSAESKMQNIENRIDMGGRSFFSYSSVSEDVASSTDQAVTTKTTTPADSISPNLLADQIKHFDNIRLDIDSSPSMVSAMAAAVAAAAAAAAANNPAGGFRPEAANYANKFATMQTNLQILTSISSLMAVENK